PVAAALPAGGDDKPPPPAAGRRRAADDSLPQPGEVLLRADDGRDDGFIAGAPGQGLHEAVPPRALSGAVQEALVEALHQPRLVLRAGEDRRRHLVATVAVGQYLTEGRPAHRVGGAAEHILVQRRQEAVTATVELVVLRRVGDDGLHLLDGAAAAQEAH